MQQNQMNPQMNTFYIQTNTPLTSMQPNSNIMNSNIFQHIRVPNNGNFQWSVSPMPNTITFNSPMQANQNNQRLEAKPNENYLINSRQPMIISGSNIGFNQRFLSPGNIVNQTQINQNQKLPNVQSQIQIQQQPRQANPQIQRIQTVPISEKQVIEIKDTPVSVISTGNNIPANNKQPCKMKDEQVEERESVNSKDMVTNSRINQMVRQIDEHLQLDDDMKGVFSQYLDDFLQYVTENAIKLAKLRNSSMLETKDFQYIMEKDWGIYIPGYPSINEKPKQSSELEIHKTRMNIIKKSNKQ